MGVNICPLLLNCTLDTSTILLTAALLLVDMENENDCTGIGGQVGAMVGVAVGLMGQVGDSVGGSVEGSVGGAVGLRVRGLRVGRRHAQVGAGLGLEEGPVGVAVGSSKSQG